MKFLEAMGLVDAGEDDLAKDLSDVELEDADEGYEEVGDADTKKN